MIHSALLFTTITQFHRGEIDISKNYIVQTRHHGVISDKPRINCTAHVSGCICATISNLLSEVVVYLHRCMHVGL